MPDVAAGSVGNSLLNFIWGQQNDPAQQMANYADTLQARNRVAAGMDVNGNILPTPGPNAQPGVGSGQITGPPQDPTAAMAAVQQTGMLPQGQEPNATRSPQSMGSMIIDLQRRQEAEAGLNTALGGIGAAISRPENRERSMKMFTGGQSQMGDPLKLGQGLMDMASQTQGQDRMNAIGQMIYDPQRGPALAKSLNNMSWEALKSAFQTNPAGIAQIVQSYYTPTDTIKNLRDIGAIGGGAQGGGADQGNSVNDARTGILTGIGGPQTQPMNTAQANWRADPKNAGKPDSAMPWKVNDLQSFTQYTANEQQKEENRGKASDVLFNNQPKAEELMSDVTTLRDSAGLKSILADPVKREFLRNALASPTGFSVPDILGRYQFTPAEQQAVALLGKINGGVYSEALHSLVGTGTRVTQQEAGPLASSVSSSKEVNMDYPDYVKQNLNPLITRAKRAIATGYGASGNFNGMDSTYAPWVHSIFKPKGELYKEGGGAENLPEMQPIPKSEIAIAKKHLISQPNGKEDVLDNWQQRGLDTSHLRTIPPSEW